ncbi:MAG: hypothetical protein M0Q92_14990 [Methanoregula sp.]|jgi:hypothetical protein|nr:hypothetical protein [Methanoregula sp.]
MIAHFLHQLTKKIQRLGYAKEYARVFAGFFFIEMVVVATLMEMLRVVQNAESYPIAVRGNGAGGYRPARFCPALLLIHS